MSDVADPTFRQLYEEAFERYGAKVLWSCRRIENPGPGDALAIALMLRTQGDLAALRLAERIEEAARAAV